MRRNCSPEGLAYRAVACRTSAASFTAFRRSLNLRSASTAAIEYLTGSLRKYDSQINYSTVNLQLYEVYRLSTDEEVPQTFGERLGFKTSAPSRSETFPVPPSAPLNIDVRY